MKRARPVSHGGAGGDDHETSPGRVYFYPHAYLRDRHLDRIRSWPRGFVLNPELGRNRIGAQVSSSGSLAKHVPAGTLLPVINLKPRPRGIPPDAVVYVCGALMLTGPYIVELDNPYALTRYNLKALPLYRRILRFLLLQERCREIRCISEACRDTLGAVLGREVYAKASVHYPPIVGTPADRGDATEHCRFLFVSTQFEIKAGPTVLRAFREVHRQFPGATLDVITHLPDAYGDLVVDCPAIRVHPARYTRDEIWKRFMQNADVLVHPTFVESFGMVVLEGLAHGLAVIATDVYALREMVKPGENGILITPPLSVWDGNLPSRHYRELSSIKDRIRALDDRQLQADLIDAMTRFAADPGFRARAREASQQLFRQRFAAEGR